MDGPHVDLAKPGGDRSHARLGARRQIRLGLGQALIDLLAREINIGLVVEDGGYLREAVARKGPRVFEPRNSGERGLEWISDLLFNINGRERWRNRVDLHLVVGDIRDRVDRQFGHRPGAEGGGRKGEQHDKPALMNGKGKNARNH